MPHPMPISPDSLEGLLSSLARIRDRAIRAGVLGERLAEMEASGP